MRIISGIYGGRRFEAPRNMQARPTTDIAKESLFNILQNRLDLEGIKTLDLFGGTGSISFELLSRGAASAVCVEMGHIQQTFIRKVADTLKVGRELQLVRGDVFKYIRSATSIAPEEGMFDFIFADPPYALPQLEEIPQLILGSNLLKRDGTFVLEHGKEHDFQSVEGFQELRIYGAVHFSFFSRKA